MMLAWHARWLQRWLLLTISIFSPPPEVSVPPIRIMLLNGMFEAATARHGVRRQTAQGAVTLAGKVTAPWTPIGVAEPGEISPVEVQRPPLSSALAYRHASGITISMITGILQFHMWVFLTRI